MHTPVSTYYVHLQNVKKKIYNKTQLETWANPAWGGEITDLVLESKEVLEELWGWVKRASEPTPGGSQTRSGTILAPKKKVVNDYNT